MRSVYTSEKAVTPSETASLSIMQNEMGSSTVHKHPARRRLWVACMYMLIVMSSALLMACDPSFFGEL